MLFLSNNIEIKIL